MRDREHVTGNHLPFWGLRYPGGFRARAILTASSPYLFGANLPYC